MRMAFASAAGSGVSDEHFDGVFDFKRLVQA